MNKKLVLGLGLVAALGSAAVLGKKFLDKKLKEAKDEGMVMGCDIIASNTISNPFVTAKCDMLNDKLVVVVSNIFGQSVTFDAITAKPVEE